MKGSLGPCGGGRKQNCRSQRHSKKERSGNKTAMIHAIDLQRLAGGSDEITENGNVRAVGSDAPSVHGQTEPLGKIEIDTRVVQLRQTETLRWQNAINSRRIPRPMPAVTPPAAPRPPPPKPANHARGPANSWAEQSPRP